VLTGVISIVSVTLSGTQFSKQINFGTVSLKSIVSYLARFHKKFQNHLIAKDANRAC
jgi:hypothetical protein